MAEQPPTYMDGYEDGCRHGFVDAEATLNQTWINLPRWRPRYWYCRLAARVLSNAYYEKWPKGHY